MGEGWGKGKGTSFQLLSDFTTIGRIHGTDVHWRCGRVEGGAGGVAGRGWEHTKEMKETTQRFRPACDSKEHLRVFG